MTFHSKDSTYSHLKPRFGNKPNPITRSSSSPKKIQKKQQGMKSSISDRIAAFLSFRVRLIPIVIFCAAMVLSVRLTTLYKHVKESPSLGFSQLHAETQTPAKDPTKAPTEKDQETVEVDPLNMTPDQYKALQSLIQKKETVIKREQDIPEKEQVLKALIAKLDQKRQELEKAKKELEAVIAKIDEHENANTKRLVKMAEAMKPAEAAKVLEGIEFPILLEIMESMKEKKASAIIAAMEAEKGSYLMTALAKRRKIFKKGDPSKSVME